MQDQDGPIDAFEEHNELYLRQLSNSRKGRLLFALSPKARRLRYECDGAQSPASHNAALARTLDACEDHPCYRAVAWLLAAREDLHVLRVQWGRRARLDRTGGRGKDYYSVATIVKDEARYIEEFVLFYLLTGADRIYVYDNDSTDGTSQVLRPYIDAGYVVYQKWPGRVVQTAAYRDAIRRTRHKTKWLALVDGDEFLFSPAGSMPEQLKAYEKYPGVGANWIVFGPNGHVARPAGLVMDNYVTTFADYDAGINHHIKSIVRPDKVLCMRHSHFAIYKGGAHAVDSAGEVLGSYPAYAPRAGRAFTRKVHRDVFRINHYTTRSLEDLEEKSRRGYPDGSPPRGYDNELRAFEEEQLVADLAIKPYADAVRSVLYGASDPGASAR